MLGVLRTVEGDTTILNKGPERIWNKSVKTSQHFPEGT